MTSSFHSRHPMIRVPSNTGQRKDANKTKILTTKEFEEFKQYYEIQNETETMFRNVNYHTLQDVMFINNTWLPIKSARPVKDVRSQSTLVEEKSSKYGVDPEDARMDWNDYHRLKVIHNFMDELESDLPSLCTTEVIGKSLEGRDLKLIKISNSDATNACVWIDAGIHAREWIAPAVNTYIANYIAKNFDSLPASVRNKDWYFLPVLNPDGYEYSHTNNRMWRKNKAYVSHTLQGVDLNRNFSFGWGGKGSSDKPKHPFYRGPRPFSEPESAAIRDVFMNSGVTFKVYITLHSFGQIIIMPFAYTETLAPDYMRLLEGATVMAKAIHDTNGNIYKVGMSRDVMYPAAGTSNDWSHGVVGIPYCYLIELRSKVHKFKVPKEEIAETGAEVLNCLIALMEFVDDYKEPVIKKESNEAPQHEEPQKNVTENVTSDKVITIEVIKAEIQEQVEDEIELQLISENYVAIECDTSKIKAVNVWKEETSTMDIMVEGPRAAQVADLLNQKEIPYSIAVPDVSGLYDNEIYSINTMLKKNLFSKAQMNWENYHRLDTIYAFMDNLAAEYPYLCTVSVIGQTPEGRDLKLLKISNGNEGNPGVWLDGTIHAREWISPASVTYIADKIVRHFHIYPDSVTKKDWYILPVLNPDGYEYTHTTDRMWRKNRARYGECIGVDLNRNWSQGWGEKGEEGSSDDPGNIFFRGPKAFSEPETAAVRRTILNSHTKFQVFLSFHSYGDAIIFPWGYTSDPCPDYLTLLEGGTAMAKAIHQTSGHTYKVGSTKDLMYYASGTSIDWSYGVAKIPFSYMVELRGKKHKFLLPKHKIIVTASEAFNGVLRLLEFAEGKYTGTQTCA